MNNESSKPNGRVNGGIRSASDPDRDPFEELADEFATRHRNGEHVSIEDYAARYPEFAAEIRELFPSVVAMEALRQSKRARQAASQAPVPEQLGDFRIVGEIARGGMGVVYEAEQLTLGRRVAVKVLPQRILASERDVQRFEREAQTAAKLHHTNIVPIFGVGEQDGVHYIVMQLIQGVGLDEVLSELKRMVDDQSDHKSSARQAASRSSHVKRSAITLLQKPLLSDASTASYQNLPTQIASERVGTVKADVDRSNDAYPRSDRRASSATASRLSSGITADYYQNVAKIGLQAASALSYAHQHDTLHRDVKPGNLLLDDEGVVWMADFGLAKAVESNDVTWTGDVVGTLAYMAPERLKGKASARSDIYSLGLTLYELLTFERAFDGGDRVALMHRVAQDELPPPRKLNPNVPRDLETIVLKAAARNPSDRYESAERLAEDLECFLADRPIQARRANSVEKVCRWCRRNRAVATIATSAVLLLVTVATAGYFRETALRRRAEATSMLAVSALDEIYGQFAPRQLSVPATEPLDASDDALLGTAELPLSQDVALLLENLLRFYDDLARQADDQSLAIKSISANRRVGDIRRRLGQFDEARATYEKAIERVENLNQNARLSQPVRLEYARVQNGLGMVLRELRSYDDMIKAHEKALESLDGKSESEEEDFERARTLYLSHLARQCHRHGKRDDTRSEPDGPTEISQAVSILQRLRAAHPAVPDYQFLLARCFLVFESDCNSDGTLNPYQSQAIAMLEELVETAPDVADYRYELGDAYRSIEWREQRRKRDVKRPAEELATSESRLRRALAITADLEAKHPNIPQYCLLIKRLHHILAMVLTETDQLPEAEQEYQQAIRRQQLIVHQSRDPHSHELWLQSLQLSHAQLLRDLGEHGQAKEYLEAIIDALEELSQRSEIKDNRFDARMTEKTLRRAYVTLASVLNHLGEKSRAEMMLRRAEEPSS